MGASPQEERRGVRHRRARRVPASSANELGASICRELHVWHDERANRAVVAAASKTNMAMEVLARLNLLTLEQVAGRDIEPPGNRFHQLVAGDREAVHIPAADKRIPGMCQHG